MNNANRLIPPHVYKSLSLPHRKFCQRFILDYRLWFLSFCFLIVSAENAHAYLDPGTGNALIYVVISLIGAVVYAAKNLFYKILRKKKDSSLERGNGKTLVIFSEGKNYWGTFKPVIEALIARKQPFAYYSMDVHDPALTIENDLMEAKYIGDGTMAFAKMNNLEADILLSTTPNIGTENYPIKKSGKVRSLIHIWHSFGDYTYAWYHHGSLDHYDEVLTAGEYMNPQIRLIEQKRGLKEKKLVPVGVPYLDELAKEREGMNADTDGKTILIAPSWGTKGCLTVYGIDFVRDLAKAGFNVIIRPHPQSLKVEKEKFDGFKRELSEFSNVVWDEEVNGSVSMAKSDLMISDTSSVRMDFFALYKRPVITLEMPVSDTSSYEYEDLKDLLAQSTMETDIGDKVSKEDIGQIVERVKAALSSTAARDFDALTAKYAVNFGHAGEAVADYLISELNK